MQQRATPLLSLMEMKIASLKSLCQRHLFEPPIEMNLFLIIEKHLRILFSRFYVFWVVLNKYR